MSKNNSLKIRRINNTHWMVNRVSIRFSKNPNKSGWYIGKNSTVFSFNDAIKKAVKIALRNEDILKNTIKMALTNEVSKLVRAQKNKDLKYEQVCVIPGLIISDNNYKEFENYILNESGSRIKFIECIETLPDKDRFNNPIPGTGGRHDVFFYVHTNDVGKFALKRFKFGVKWLEDVLSNVNYKCHIYPDRVYDYVSWNEPHIDFLRRRIC